MTRTSSSLKGLKAATYNPRTISTRQSQALLKSYVDYGDLSGIVENETTGNLIGGHQRVSAFRKRETRIVAKPHIDSTGTVALGYAIVPTAGGGHIRIPYRRVRFDRNKEMAANIAANAAGGEFDDVKLGRVLSKLEANRFPIEGIPLDGLDVRRTIRAFESAQKRENYSRYDADGDGGGEGFALIDADALKTAAQHQCPSCGYFWSGSTKPSFAELHRLTDDNPMKKQANVLALQIKKRMKKTGEDAKTAAAKVAIVRDKKIASGEIDGLYVKEHGAASAKAKKPVGDLPPPSRGRRRK